MNKIKELRQKEKISLAKLSQALKDDYAITASPQTLMRYEKEETQPKLDIFEAIADFFNVPVGFLMGISTDVNWLDSRSGFDAVIKDPLIFFERAFPQKLDADLDVKVSIGTLLIELTDDLPKNIPGIEQEPRYNANSFIMESIRSLFSSFSRRPSIDSASTTLNGIIEDFNDMVEFNKSSK